MKTAYSRPTDWTVAVVGTDSAFVSDPTAMFNGRPADPTRLLLPSDWSGVVGEYVELQFTRATAIAPGLVGVIGFNPIGLASAAGIKITFAGKRAGDAGFTYDLGGNTALVRTRTRWDGSTLALGLCDDGLDPIIGFAMRIYNDQAGAANMAAAGYLDLGDAWGSPARDIDIDAGWKFQYPKGNVPTSINGQPWPAPFPPGRILPVARDLLSFEDAYIDGATPCYQSLARLLGNGRVSIQIPKWLDAAGAIDIDAAHETAMFCTADFDEISQSSKSQTRYKASWTNTEVPALLAD